MLCSYLYFQILFNQKQFRFMSEIKLNESVVAKINLFLQQDNQGFHIDDKDKKFQPSEILIQILKQKATKKGILEKSQDLITKQNQCEQIIEQVTEIFSTNLQNIINSPNSYGKQLQVIRNDINAAKKRIISTKQALIKNEKDLIQLNYNSIYNKIIFEKLKSVQSELNKYNLALTSFKHNNYEQCSKLMPVITGQTFLQHNINFKTDNLKNDLFLKCCNQLYKFCFFTENVIYPTQTIVIQRIKQKKQQWNMDDSVPDMENHLQFYEKYKLFKKIDVVSYLKSLWKFSDIQNKTDKISGVLKAVFNIGKSQQLFEYISMNYGKVIPNIYVLITIFYLYDKEKLNLNIKNDIDQFALIQKKSESMFNFLKFNSSSKMEEIKELCNIFLIVSAILFRRFIIVYKLYEIYKMQINSVYKIQFRRLLIIICQQIRQIMFQIIQFHKFNDKYANDISDIKFSINKQKNPTIQIKKWFCNQFKTKYQFSILCFPIILNILNEYLQKYIIENLILSLELELHFQVEDLKFQKSKIYNNYFVKYEQDFNKQVLNYQIEALCFHFNKLKNRLFMNVPFDEFNQLINLNQMHTQLNIGNSLKLIKSYISNQKKQTIKQFYLVCFQIQELVAYEKLTKYNHSRNVRIYLMILTLFYSRIYQFASKEYMTNKQYLQKIMNKRTDKRIRDQQNKYYEKFPKIFRKMEEVSIKKTLSRMSYMEIKQFPSSFMNQIKIVERIKILLLCFEYMFDHLNQLFQSELDGINPTKLSDQYCNQLQKAQDSNAFNGDMKFQLKQLYDVLPQETNDQKQYLLAFFRKSLQLFFILRMRCKIQI